MPPGWTIGNTIRTTDGGEQVSLLDAASPFTWVAVWMTPVVNTPAEVNAAIELVMPAKLDQRLGLFAGYQFRPESTQHLFIANHRAVRAVADFAQGSCASGRVFHVDLH